MRRLANDLLFGAGQVLDGMRSRNVELASHRLDNRALFLYDCRIPAFRRKDYMETVKLGRKGQMSIPKGILKRLGIEGEATLLVDTTAEGAIVLRPAAVYPIEIYSDERVRDFDVADRMDAKTAARLARILNKK